jgi:hypothetical protein
MAWKMYYSSTRDVSFWWRDCLTVFPTFNQIAQCDFQPGNYILLWQDSWSQIPLKDTWPHLFSFCKNEAISLKQALLISYLADMFHLPLSEEALAQFHLFQAFLITLEPSENVDYWTILGKI